MKKRLIIASLIVLTVMGGVCLLTSISRSRSRAALAACKAELRARGEKLTFEEAGYPFPLETNANLENFIGLADRLRGKSKIPGTIDVMPFKAPGQVLVVWAGRDLQRAGTDRYALNPTCDELVSDMQSAASLLAEIRAELEHPPRHFGWNYTNPFSQTPKNPFVQKRTVAQFLAADTLCALREDQLPRAQADLHVLTQLAQVHRGDWLLVNAMIRVAIAGLGLSTTYEALPADGWDDSSLLALQRDWEAVDLLEAAEHGLAGERMFGEMAFSRIRESDPQALRGMFGPGGSKQGGFAGLKDAIQQTGIGYYWRGHIDDDELFYLQLSQARVEMLRRLRANVGATRLQADEQAIEARINAAMSSPLGRLQHLFSAIAIPNFNRGLETCVQHETERRLTILAIALKRFQLRHNRYPSALVELTPEFLPAELMDPWSGRPFQYRLNVDGIFTLYSVGADGRDDGGEPNSPGLTNAPPSLWTGRDAVWPSPVFPASRR